MSISRDIIAIGVLGESSLESMRQLISDLPADFPASILVALQVPAEVSMVEQILIRKAAMPFVWTREGQNIRRGYVYLGSPYAHLVTRPWGVLGLEPAMANDFRHVALNRFFDSAASVWGNRVIGVLLNSKDDARTTSLDAIRSANGIAVVEDREHRFSSSMRESTDGVDPRHLLPSSDIVALLGGLMQLPMPTFAGHLSFRLRNRTLYGC